MRYTSRKVHDFHTIIRNRADRGEEFDRYLANAFQVGGDIGYGTRYIGIGGRMTVDYSGAGARKAVAFLYGVGVELCVFSKMLVDSDKSDWDFSQQIMGDVDADTVAVYRALGEEYVRKYVS